MSDELQGQDFRALRRLSTRDGAGGWVVVAEVGETCERVPPVSLAPLLASGKIERVSPAPVADPAEAPASTADDEPTPKKRSRR